MMMTQTRFSSQGVSPSVHYSQTDGYRMPSKNWRLNTGFKKLQKRIEDRQKSGKSNTGLNKKLPDVGLSLGKSGVLTSSRQLESTSGVTSRLQPLDVTGTGAKRADTKKLGSRSQQWRSATTSGGKTRGVESKEGPNMSLQYELYRTSNNGLARISARMKQNAFRRPSRTSIDFSDSLSLENYNPTEKCSDQQPQQMLPEINKSKPVLLKTEIAKLDSRYDSDFEEELEERIMKWVASCKLYNSFDSQPYADLDKKHSSRSKSRVTSSPRSKATETPRGLDKSKTCL